MPVRAVGRGSVTLMPTTIPERGPPPSISRLVRALATHIRLRATNIWLRLRIWWIRRTWGRWR